MESVYERMLSLYNENGSTKTPVKVVFKEPVVLTPFVGRSKINKEYDQNGRLIRYTLTRKPKKEYNLYLHKSSSGQICFSNKATRVKKIYSHYVLFNDIQVESIELNNQDTKYVNPDIENRKYILNNLHKNLWNDIRIKLEENRINDIDLFRENAGQLFKKVSIKSVFPKWVIDNVKDAIENKRDFSYRMSGTRRDKSIEVKLDENGQLRAWYSSEFSGIVNGAYYLLINPTTAIFYQYD